MRWLTSLLAFGLVWSSVSLPDANAINPPGPVGGIGHGRYWHRNPAGAAGGWGRGWNYNPPGPGRVSYVNYRPHVNPPGLAGGAGHGPYWTYNQPGPAGGAGRGWTWNPPGQGQWYYPGNAVYRP
ncbi:MAG: hypothetical protein U0105_19265 [Candidatus Obscuribacterales bacterium]